MNILTQNTDKSINSHQISEMLDIRHDKVKQSIKRLSTDKRIRKSVIALPPTGVVQTIANNRSYETEVYIFSGEQGRLDSIIVVAQLSPEFTGALVKRWDELERQVAQPAAPVFQIPQTLGEALQLAADQAKQLEIAAPKVAHYDKVVDRHTLLTATQVGQKIHMSAVKLNRMLDELGVYNQAHKRGRAFRQWFIDKGLGEMKQTDMGHSQPLFSLKGEAWVVERLANESFA